MTMINHIDINKQPKINEQASKYYNQLKQSCTHDAKH